MNERLAIVETGAPDDLRKQSGLYARLASLQFDACSNVVAYDCYSLNGQATYYNTVFLGK